MGTGSAPRYARAAPISLLLGLTVAVGPLAHYMLSALGPMVIDELDLTRTQFGGFWAITFGAAAVLTLPAGRLTDRLGPRPAMIAVLIAGVVALLVLGASSSYWLLVVGLALAGCAQSASNAATNSSVAAYVAPADRGLVIGAKQSGVQLGQLAVGLLAPLFAIWVGWRTGFFALAAIGVVGLAFALRLPRQRPAPAPHTDSARRPRMTLPLFALVVYAIATGMVIQAANVYMPLFAFEDHALPAELAGLVTAVLGGVGVAARLVWGRFLDRVRSLAFLRSLLAVTTACGLVLVGLSPALGIAWMWIGIGVFSATAMAATVVLMLEVVRDMPGRIGYASGYVSLGLMGGFMMGPVIFGVVVDATGRYGWAWALLVAVAGVQLLLNVLLQRAVRRRSDASR